jgi:hypothetical protein
MVIRQYLANQSLHTQQVEDFLRLHERGNQPACDHLYQVLVQQLPHLGERALVQDLQRTTMFVDLKTPQLDNLVWKYCVSVNNELKQRSEKRIAAALQTSARE